MGWRRIAPKYLLDLLGQVAEHLAFGPSQEVGTDQLFEALAGRLPGWGVEASLDGQFESFEVTVGIDGGTSEEFRALVKKETPKWAEVVRRSGAKVD